MGKTAINKVKVSRVHRTSPTTLLVEYLLPPPPPDFHFLEVMPDHEVRGAALWKISLENKLSRRLGLGFDLQISGGGRRGEGRGC